MVEDDLLVPHLLDSVVVVALHGVVVLVDLDAQAAAGGKVVRLGQVTQAVMLHSLTIMGQSKYDDDDEVHLEDVLHPHPLPPGVPGPPLAGLRPDFVK